MRFIRSDQEIGMDDSSFAAQFGTHALWQPGFLAATDQATAETFQFVSLVPFSARRPDGRVGVYRVGRWPTEARRSGPQPERLPDGFIPVEPADTGRRVSTHFTLGSFLSRGQNTIWPKFLVLDERLIDKLELIITELRVAGHEANGLVVLSGFRTPSFNARGERSRLSTDSRHLYGDAADVFVDADADGRMDDLDRNGRIDHGDALAFAAMVERVERRYPELVGGLGAYRAAPGQSLFLHVDVRGHRVRWGFE
jgi:hypothetical protein